MPAGIDEEEELALVTAVMQLDAAAVPPMSVTVLATISRHPLAPLPTVAPPDM
jgi:hypothetical protein